MSGREQARLLLYKVANADASNASQVAVALEARLVAGCRSADQLSRSALFEQYDGSGVAASLHGS